MNTLALDYHPPRREWVNGPWLRSNGLATSTAGGVPGLLDQKLQKDELQDPISAH